MAQNVENINVRNKDQIKEDINQLKTDADRVKGDLTDIFRRIIDIGKEETGSAKSLIESESNKLISEVDEILAKSKIRSKEQIQNVSKKVEERPFLSLFGAFAAGIVVSKLISKD